MEPTNEASTPLEPNPPDKAEVFVTLHQNYNSIELERAPIMEDLLIQSSQLDLSPAEAREVLYKSWWFFNTADNLSRGRGVAVPINPDLNYRQQVEEAKNNLRDQARADLDPNLFTTEAVLGRIETFAQTGLQERYDMDWQHWMEAYAERDSAAYAFDMIAGQRTAPDHVWCCYNGMSSHMVVRDFFDGLLQSSNLTPDQVTVYQEVRNQAEFMRQARGLVLDLFIADMATDADMRVGAREYEFLANALDGSRDRVVDQPVFDRLTTSTRAILGVSDNWLGQVQRFEKLSLSFAQEGVREYLLKQGMLLTNPNSNYVRSLLTLNQLTDVLADLHQASQNQDNRVFKEVLPKMNRQVAEAEGYLEEKFYFGFISLLEKLEEGGGTLRAEDRAILRSTEL
jgi:hypothetical protein